MFFDSNLRKYEHIITYFDNKAIYPTVRISHDGKYSLGIVVMKWNNESEPNKGKFIAIKVISDFIADWNIFDKDSLLSTIDNSINEIIGYNEDDVRFTPNNDIFVFKFSVNCWRHVILKKVKWVFSGKKPCYNSIEFLCH